MTNFTELESTARTWATSHLVVAILIGAAVGVLVGAWFF